MFLCVYSCGPLTFFLNFINVCRNRLILQVLAAHTLHIPKKGLFQNWPLDSSWKLGSESLERSSGATQRQSDEMLRTSKCHCSEPPICSVGWSLGKLRQALHVCSITPVQTLDSRLRWASLVITHCCWYNYAHLCGAAGGAHLEAVPSWFYLRPLPEQAVTLSITASFDLCHWAWGSWGVPIHKICFSLLHIPL